MRTLARAVTREAAVGSRIKLPWYDLERLVTMYTKELAVIAGGPGGGKSTVAINMLMNTDVPALYIAQDSEQSVLARMAALALGITTSEARERMTKEASRVELGRELATVRPSLVVAAGAHTLELITERVDALQEWIGHYPRIVVLDNLIDSLAPGFNYTDQTFYSYWLPRLKQLAIERDLLFVVLHHVIRRSDGGTSIGTGAKKIRLTDVLYAGERESRHVWGVYHQGDREMRVQVLKQTDGPADPEGDLDVGLVWHPEFGSLRNG